jgi:hypothetical protein
MDTEHKIRRYIRKMLLEVEQTRRPGRGGYKKEIQAAGALAKKNPGELLRRLGVGSVSGQDDIEKLNSLLKQAVAGSNAAKAMTNVFSEPQPRQDKQTSYKGIRIPVQIIPPRDARKYLEHTVLAAQAAGKALFVDDIQIEILGNDVLLYFSPRPYSWGKQKVRTGQSTKKPEPAADAQAEAGKKRQHILGEPDLNPDRASEKKKQSDEASVSSMVSGPITPLGTGPTYPDKPKKKPKSAAEITGRAFGGAKPVKKKKKN